MKRTILIPILLSTFLLIGCESELDRCIEGNFSVDIWEVREKYRLWSLEEEPRKRFSIERSFTADEGDIRRCVYNRRDTQEAVMDESSPYGFYNQPKFKGKPPIDFEMKTFDDNAEACIQKEKEKAKKICHRQGIY